MLRKISIFAVLALFFLTSHSFAAKFEVKNKGWNTGANFRSQPYGSYETYLGHFDFGKVCDYLGKEQNGYYQVNCDGQIGWIHHKTGDIIAEQAAAAPAPQSDDGIAEDEWEGDDWEDSDTGDDEFYDDESW